MANTFKPYIDKQMWDYVAPAPYSTSSGRGYASDLRTHGYADPRLFLNVDSTYLLCYSKIQKSFQYVGSPGLSSHGSGQCNVFCPSFSIIGTVGSGSSTSAVVLSAATVAGSAISAVAPNQFANRGDGTGYRIRVIGSGKVEERTIVGNTGSITPTLYLDTPLTFTPASGNRVEFLSGRVMMLGAGAVGSTTFRSYSVANTGLNSLGYTNLPATIGTDSVAIALDEQYNPYNRLPGEGFLIGSATYDDSGTVKGCLAATATATGSLTGQSSGGDASVLANEYRNFQIRIVEDTTNPTAVNQRRIIASHTAGPSPVYTLGSNWTVTPSSNAKYVIELPNLLFMRSSATSSVYVYNYTDAAINNGTESLAANAWSTTYFATAPAAHGSGVMLFPSFGIVPDAQKLSRQSYVYGFRGGGASSVDLFDIAGGATGTWTSGIAYWGGALSFTTGSCGMYAPGTHEGRYAYLNYYSSGALNQIHKFDVKNRVLLPVTQTDWIQSATAYVGGRMATYTLMDGSDAYTIVFLQSMSSTVCQELLVLVD